MLRIINQVSSRVKFFTISDIPEVELSVCTFDKTSLLNFKLYDLKLWLEIVDR